MGILFFRHCVAFVSALILSISLWAQYPSGGGQPPAICSVKGLVKDLSSKQAIEYATVAVYSIKDSSVVSGGITDAKGFFEIKELKFGRYNVKISFIGYKNYVSETIIFGRDGTDKDLGIIMLQPSTEIEGVDIVVDAPVITTSIDKKVFNADKNITSTGGTALDLLRNVPSVQVDQDGGVSLRGNSNITVLIDGKPSGLTGSSRQALLEQLPASSIENIEIITNPSAKYDPDGMAGIINIVLKKNKIKGTNGSISTSIGNANHISNIADKYNFNGSLNYRNEKVNLYSNYSFNYNGRIRRGFSNRETFFPGTDTIGLNQITDALGYRNSNLLKLGGDYYINKKNTLSLSSTYSINGNRNNQIVSFEDLINSNTISFRDRSNNERESGQNLDLTSSFSHDFSKPKQNLTLQLNHSEREDSEKAYFLEDYFNANRELLVNDSIQQNNYENNKNKITTIQADFVYPINEKLKIESGYKSVLRNINNEFISETFNDSAQAFLNDVLLTNTFNYDEKIHAVYGITAYQITSKIGAQLGARVEQTYTISTLVNTSEPFKNKYFNIFPSGYLSYSFDQFTSLNLSYSRRINRPSIRALNPFTDYSNPQNLRVGNPFLMPEYINSFELAYSKFFGKNISFNPSIYFKNTSNVIQRVTTVNENNISIIRQENVGQSYAYGTEIVLSGKVMPFWRITVSGNGYWNRTIGSVSDIDLNNDAFGGNGNFMNDFTINDDVAIQISSWVRAPIYFAQGYMKTMGAIDFAYKHTIWKGKADISIRVSDVFNFQRFAMVLYQPTFNSQNYHKWESRNVFLNFSYRFGKMEYNSQQNSGGRWGRGRNNGKGNEGEFKGGDGGGGGDM